MVIMEGNKSVNSVDGTGPVAPTGRTYILGCYHVSESAGSTIFSDSGIAAAFSPTEVTYLPSR